MENINPLRKFFRQPKNYIRLPSSGNFYPQGSLEKTETGEYAVYAMTAKDELVMKTPDALLNGQATVEVIQSCVPSIKNAWAIPSIDIDAILVAIRIATYGEKLDLEIKMPGTNELKTYELDLRIILDKLISSAFDQEIVVNSQLKVYIRPLSYKEFTQTATKALEEQRIFSIVNDNEMDNQKKLEIFNASFRKLTDININMVSTSIIKIVTDEGETSNPEFIKEFIDNADKDFYKAIIDHLETQKKKFAIEPQKIITTDEERAAGAPDHLEIPITLDSSNFFA